MNDLEIGFLNLKHAIQDVCINEVNSVFCNTKIPLEMRFHQDLITFKQMNKIDEGEKELLDAFAPESPKEWTKNPNEWLSSLDILQVMNQ